MTTELRSACEFQKAIWTINTHFSRFRRNDLDAETSGLDHCTSREVGAGESAWKPEIVFNTTRHAGLTTRRFALDHHCAQSFARAVNCRGESGWTTADDYEIVEIFCRASSESGMFSEVRE